MAGVRLQRVLAAAGVGARRQCERLIEEGRVQVNGRKVTRLPVFIDPRKDRITVDGRPVTRKGTRLVYIMVNKPERVLTAAADEPGIERTTVMDLVDHPAKARLFPVGRLDYQTAGLVLLTNDGALANRLTHPRYEVPKTYSATVKGILDVVAVGRVQTAVQKELRKADRFAGRVVPATASQRIEIEIAGYEEERTLLRMTVRDGQSGNIARMLAAAGVHVRRLERTAIGPLELRAVRRGQWRELEKGEISVLRKAARQAGIAAHGHNPEEAQQQTVRRGGRGWGVTSAAGATSTAGAARGGEGEV
jgi:23S rRNA pseudouridine2605 synthase